MSETFESDDLRRVRKAERALRMRHVMWFAMLWAGGVAALGAVAYAIRAVLI